MDNYSVGLSWPTFFMSKDVDKEKSVENFKEYMSNKDLANYDIMKHFQRSLYECKRAEVELFINAVAIVVLRWCLVESDFASSILNDEELRKCRDLYKRKQFKSSKIKSLLAHVAMLDDFILTEISVDARKLYDLLFKDISVEIEKLRNEAFLKEFKPLVKVINEITSGVKKECYLSVRDHDEDISSEVIDYVKDNYNYNLSLYDSFNTAQSYINSSIYGNMQPLLRSLLLYDKAFWESKKDFNLISFIAFIQNVHGVKYVFKIVDYMMQEIKKHEWFNKFITKSLKIPVMCQDDIINKLVERSYDSAFGVLGQDFYEKTQEHAEYLVYPIRSSSCKSSIENIKVNICRGHAIFDKFIKTIFCDHIDAINVLFADIHNKFLLNSISNYKKSLTVAIILDKDVLGYVPSYNDIELLKLVDDDFMSDENVWNRLYLKCYLISCAVDEDTVHSYIYEVFYGLFKIIGEEFNIQTSMQNDKKLRNEKFNELSNVMLSYGLDIANSTCKNLYINALLDRKMALVDEVQKFPELEQLGDAIYGFALSELAFYNVNNAVRNDHFSKRSIYKEIESRETAEFQVKISKTLGLDNAYISTSVYSYKYDRGDSLEFDVKDDSNEAYLADTVEMIIAVVCKDFGLSAAISFAEKLISSTDENFGKILREADSVKRYQMTEVNRSYWEMCRPAEFSECSHYHTVHWRAVDKLLKTHIIGTDTKEKRDMITIPYRTNNFYKALMLNDSDVKNFDFIINPVFYDYLNNDIQFVIEKYKEMFNVELSE